MEVCSGILKMRYNKELTYELVKDKALRLLEFRSHSEKELRDKLKRYGAEQEDIDKVIEFCIEYNFINDEDFAKRKAADLKNLKKYGKNRIKSELYAIGINSYIIEDVISKMDFDDEEDVLYPLVMKKLNNDFEKKSIDRCVRYFIYRGYEINDIKNAIDKCKPE